jgi:hypothetical protein
MSPAAYSVLRALALFFISTGTGFLLAQATTSPEPAMPLSRDSQSAVTAATPVRDRTPGPELRAEAKSTPRTPTNRTDALPPADSRIVDNYDDLAKRARRGDAAAARRLAEDLGACARLDTELRMTADLIAEDEPDTEDIEDEATKRRIDAQRSDNLSRAEAEAKRHQRVQARCNNIEEIDARAGEWLRLAAANGDAEAGLCYALFPARWESRLLSPRWLDDMEASAAQAPHLVRRAFDAGMAEAAAALSVMYRPAIFPNADASFVMSNPWRGRVGDDPYWALAYAVVAQRALGGPASQRWLVQTQQLERALPPERAAQARTWADAQLARIRFSPVESTPSSSWCRRSIAASVY